MLRPFLFGAFGALACIGTASAHATLEVREAPVGTYYKAVIRIPHGCGGTATTAVRIRIPAGVLDVKPMPKTGWKLDTVSGKYSSPVTLRGAAVTDGITEVSWSGGNLPDAYFDEFAFMAFISDALEPGKTIYFPVVQECEKGVHRWIEIPTDRAGHGDHSAGAVEPAPGLKLLPKK